MQNNDLISRKALSEEISSLTMTITGLGAGKGVLRELLTEYRKTVLRIIDEQPTVDALPLRCRIGDTVWIVGTKCLSGLFEEECDRHPADIDYCDICPLDQEYIVFPRKVNGILFLYIHNLEDNELFKWGETVFATNDAAEAALAKMG